MMKIVFQNIRKFLVIFFAYLTLYLVSVRDLSLTRSKEVSFVLVPLSRMFSSKGFFQFEAISKIVIPPIAFLFSPLNLLIASCLSFLVALNVVLVYVRITSPQSCKVSDSVGIISSFPALLSSAACCGPLILLVLGIQATGLILSVFQIAIPISFIFLIISSYILSKRIE